jgi:hypothetical protein
MENIPCASLVLRTTNSTANTRKTSFTWNNINLRAVLGNMFDMYDDFNIILTQISSATCNSTLGATTDDLNLYATIDGLPFLNQGYNAGQQTGSAILCVVTYTRDQPMIQNNLHIPLTFSKNQQLANITITYEKITGSSISSTVNYPECVFIFKIYGVPK